MNVASPRDATRLLKVSNRMERTALETPIAANDQAAPTGGHSGDRAGSEWDVGR
jgi:hypothetical protein